MDAAERARRKFVERETWGRSLSDEEFERQFEEQYPKPRHRVRAWVFNIDANRHELCEFEVSDDVYKIITNGIGASYSISDESLRSASGGE